MGSFCAQRTNNSPRILVFHHLACESSNSLGSILNSSQRRNTFGLVVHNLYVNHDALAKTSGFFYYWQDEIHLVSISVHDVIRGDIHTIYLLLHTSCKQSFVFMHEAASCLLYSTDR